MNKRRQVERMQPCTLKDVLEGALDGTLPSAWIYLSDLEDIGLNTMCILVPDDEDVELNEDGLPVLAVRLGLPRAGLNRDMVEDVVAWARSQGQMSVDLLLEGFIYHLRNDSVPLRATP